MITVTSSNGLTAECRVTVSDPDSVELNFCESSKVDIFNMNGILLKKNASKEDVERLSQGFYIIGGKKVAIH